MLLKYYMAVPRFFDVKQTVRNYAFPSRPCLKYGIFRTAPGTDDNIVKRTCI